MTYKMISSNGSTELGECFGPWRLGQGEVKLEESDGNLDVIRFEEYSPP